jgi:hypothetical protein
MAKMGSLLERASVGDGAARRPHAAPGLMPCPTQRHCPPIHLRSLTEEPLAPFSRTHTVAQIGKRLDIRRAKQSFFCLPPI